MKDIYRLCRLDFFNIFFYINKEIKIIIKKNLEKIFHISLYNLKLKELLIKII